MQENCVVKKGLLFPYAYSMCSLTFSYTNRKRGFAGLAQLRSKLAVCGPQYKMNLTFLNMTFDILDPHQVDEDWACIVVFKLVRLCTWLFYSLR